MEFGFKYARKTNNSTVNLAVATLGSQQLVYRFKGAIDRFNFTSTCV